MTDEIPTPNTRWVVILNDRNQAETMYDWLEQLGCEVKRSVAPVPLSEGKAAIGTLAPPNLDEFVADDSDIAQMVSSVSPQLPPGAL